MRVEVWKKLVFLSPSLIHENRARYAHLILLWRWRAVSLAYLSKRREWEAEVKSELSILLMSASKLIMALSTLLTPERHQFLMFEQVRDNICEKACMGFPWGKQFQASRTAEWHPKKSNQQLSKRKILLRCCGEMEEESRRGEWSEKERERWCKLFNSKILSQSKFTRQRSTWPTSEPDLTDCCTKWKGTWKV